MLMRIPLYVYVLSVTSNIIIFDFRIFIRLPGCTGNTRRVLYSFPLILVSRSDNFSLSGVIN